MGPERQQAFEISSKNLQPTILAQDVILANSSRNMAGQTEPHSRACNPKFFGKRQDSLANKMSPNPLSHGKHHKRMESNQVFGNLFDHLEAEGKQMHIKQFK